MTPLKPFCRSYVLRGYRSEQAKAIVNSLCMIYEGKLPLICLNISSAKIRHFYFSTSKQLLKTFYGHACAELIVAVYWIIWK